MKYVANDRLVNTLVVVADDDPPAKLSTTAPKRGNILILSFTISSKQALGIYMVGQKHAHIYAYRLRNKNADDR